MSDKIKIRATLVGDVTTVKTQIIHPMDTGLFKDSKGVPIPAYYIQEVKVEHNGNPILEAVWGIAISKNPYTAFNFTGGKKGDTIKLSWVDNKGGTDSIETTIETGARG